MSVSERESLLNIMKEHQMIYEADVQSCHSSSNNSIDKISVYKNYNNDLVEQNKFLLSTCFELQEKCHLKEESFLEKCEILEEMNKKLENENKERENKILLVVNEYEVLKEMYEAKNEQLARLKEQLEDCEYEDANNYKRSNSNQNWGFKEDQFENEDKNQSIERWLENSVNMDSYNNHSKDYILSENKSLQVKIEAMASNQSKLRDQCDELRTHLSRQIEDSNLKQSALESKESLCQNMNEEISSFKNYYKTLNSQIVSLQESETRLLRENSSLKSQLTHRSDNICNFDIQERDEIIQKLVDELDKTRSAAKQIQGLIKKKDDEIISLTKSRDSLHAHYSQRIQKYEEYIPARIEREKDKSVEDACRPLRTENSVMKETIFKLINENKNLYRKTDVLMEEVQSWQGRCEKQQIKIEEVVLKMSNTDIELKKANENISNMAVESSIHMKKMDDLTYELKESKSKNNEFNLEKDRKDYKIAQLEQELSHFKEENIINIEQISMFENQVKSLTQFGERERERANIEKNQDIVHIENLEKKLMETQYLLKTEREQIDKYDHFIEEREIELQQTKGQIEVHLTELAQQSDNLKECEARIHQECREKEEIYSQMTEMSSEMKNICLDRSNLLEKIDQQNTQINSLEHTIESQFAEIRRLTDDKFNLGEKLNTYEKHVETCNLEIKSNEANVSTLEEKLELCRKEISCLTAENRSIKQEKESQLTILDQKEEALQKNMRQLKEMNENALDICKDFQDYKFSHLYSNDNYEKLVEEIRSQKREMSDLYKIDETREREFSQMQDQIVAIKNESSYHKEEQCRWERRFVDLKEKAEKIFSRAFKKAKKMESSIRELTKQNTDQMEQMSKLTSELEEKNIIIHNLREEEKSNSARINGKQSQLVALSADVEARQSSEFHLREDIAQHKEEIEQMRSCIFNYEEEIKNLKTMKKTLKEQLGQSQDQLGLNHRQNEVISEQLHVNVAESVKLQHIISRNLNELYSCREEIKLAKEETSGVKQINDELKLSVLRFQKDGYKFEKEIKNLKSRLEKSEQERGRLEQIVLKANYLKEKQLIREDFPKITDNDHIIRSMLPEREKQRDFELSQVMSPSSESIISHNYWINKVETLKNKLSQF